MFLSVEFFVFKGVLFEKDCEDSLLGEIKRFFECTIRGYEKYTLNLSV